MKIFKDLFRILNYKERISFFKLILMMLMMAVIEMLGIASMLPFITILTNPDIIQTNFLLKNIFDISKNYGVENIDQFNFVLGVIVFFLIIFSISFKAVTHYAQFYFVDMREYSICKRLLKSYLSQPYYWFLNRHSADLGKTILTEVQEIVGGCLRPSMDLISKSFVVIAILTLLLWTDPKLTLIIFFFLGFCYLLIFLLIKKKVSEQGKIRLETNHIRFKTLSEVFSAVKEIKIGGHEENYIKFFNNSASKYAKAKLYSQIFSHLPRFLLEAITFGGIILLTLYLILEKGSFNQSIPIISLYVFAGYRLLPSIQNIYSSISKIIFFSLSLEKIIDDLKDDKEYINRKKKETLNLEDKIALKNVFFRYPNTSKDTLENINILFPSKSITGLIGTTGSGKTTIIDIVLGLLEPQKGTLEVDSKIITKDNLGIWHNTIGYVPQNINLIDDTIMSNIALGNEYVHIDKKLVEKVSKIAKLHDFVTNDLPLKYQTRIGERGVRLSGGERQRVGIARALYMNPKVLVLDEATSALDDQTEKEIMDSIKNLSKSLTVIMVAHRMNTIKYCNLIYKIEKGRLIKYGTYKNLL